MSLYREIVIVLETPYNHLTVISQPTKPVGITITTAESNSLLSVQSQLSVMHFTKFQINSIYLKMF